jgi:prophage tail gpP-like protein
MFDSNIKADTPQEVSLVLKGRRFRFWTEINVVQKVDGFSQFSLTVPLDPESEEIQTNFVPFEYPEVGVYVGGDLKITGTIVAIVATSSADNKLLTVKGYAKPAVLNDCNAVVREGEIPRFESDNANLRDIVDPLISPFGLTAQYESDVGAVFDRADLEPDQPLLSFFINLAQQRGLVLSDDPSGALRFRVVAPTPSVARITEDTQKFISAAAQYSGQEYFSDVTGLTAALSGVFEAEALTIANPFLSGVVRPHIFKFEDVEGADARKHINAKFAKMFSQAITLDLSVNSWLDDEQNLWAPGNTLQLLAPGVLVRRETQFMIRRVELSRTSDGGDRANLALVLPTVFNSQIPTSVPWVE